MKTLIRNAAIVLISLPLLGADCKSATTGASAPAATPTAAPAGVALSVTVETEWDTALGTRTTHTPTLAAPYAAKTSCQFNTTDTAAGAQMVCTFKIPEGQLYFSN